MSEQSAVQNPLIKYAAEIGWKYIKAEDALRLRGGDDKLYFADILRSQLIALNPGLVTPSLADDIIRSLNLLSTTIEGNRIALEWFQGIQSVFVPSESRERNVTTITYPPDSLDRNVYHVTDEWWVKGPAFRNRADIVFLINGIPVAVAETKNVNKTNGIEEGIDQIRRYHRETPALFTTSQVFEVTHLVNFWYGATWNASRKDLFNWKEVETGNFEQKVKRFFDRRAFLKTLRDYIIFLKRDEELSKVILRQHQMRAVEKVVERVQVGEKKRGLIWHTQGSGKTLTMITIASQLLAASDSDKPTIIMLVDRNELEAQLFRNISAYGIRNVVVAGSKLELQKLLRDDYRGLVVSMIHKFDDIPATINARSNIVVLVDEAHRTTGGDLGNYLMGALPNASYIGFTGTPIDRISKGQGTFKVFGGDDTEGYLDKYSIRESIEDGTTVKLNYALAPSDLRVDKEVLEREFLSLAEAEGIDDVEELNTILDRAVKLKEIMKTPDRVERIASYIAEHYRETVLPLGFKAFLVAVDREACALYKQALDRYLPPAWSEVVYSPSHNDSEALKAYYHDSKAEEDIRKAFKKKDTNPRILIVTEKLLTGFDAPILYCMYLDKPMRDHVLLQAIARVNRPYEDDDGLIKPNGFVLDFVGIFERLESALAFDSDVVSAALENIDVLKNMFARRMEQDIAPYMPYLLYPGYDNKAAERAADAFSDKKKREAFYRFFGEMEALYDVISPDAFLRPYLDRYMALAELYKVLRSNYNTKPYADRELTAKTRALLRQHSSSTTLELPGTIHELGARELEALKQSAVSDNIKVLNLSKLLAITVARDGVTQPFLISIGERAEALRDAYDDRRMTTQQALEAFEKLAREAADAGAEQQQLGIDANTYAIYSSLRAIVPSVTVETANAINQLFIAAPDYRWNDQVEQRLRSQLYGALLPVVGREKMIDVASTLLKNRPL
jgi:type I restriction enzyme, R subunit